MVRLKIKRSQPKASEYWSIHTHSRYSKDDALPTVEDMVARAVEMNQPALALTDHGNMCGAIDLYLACKKAGIKAFPGSEMYFVLDRNDKKAKRYHLGLVAYTEEGYRNLCKISTRSHENHHHKPLLDFADMAEMYEEGLTEGIALTTGCFFGLVIQRLHREGYDSAKKTVATFARWFDVYVEVQAHCIDSHGDAEEEGVEYLSEAETAEKLCQIADELGLHIVISQDSHYLRPEDRPLHEALKSLTSWGDPGEAVFPGDGFHMADEEWMKSHHSEEIYRRGIAGLQHLLSKHTLTIPEVDEYHYHVPTVANDGQYTMEKRCRERLEELNIADKKHVDRLEEEFDIIRHAGMADYMLLVAEVCEHMRSEAMYYQIRGSAGGSLICYLLEITSVDPMKWRLEMARFLSKDRTKPPDIDIDIEHTRRGELLEWISQRFASVQICTQGTYSITSDEEGSTGGSLAVKWFSAARRATGRSGLTWDDIPSEDKDELIALSDMGLLSNFGVHAAGVVVVSNRSKLSDLVPMMYVPSSSTMVTQYDGKTVEKLGLVKLDVLGVKNLTILREATELIGRDPKEGLDFIPLDDKETYELITEGSTEGVFQLSGKTAARNVPKLRPRKIDDVIAAMALFRPGVMMSGATDTFIARKNRRDTAPERHEIIKRHTRRTFGIMLYQDQVIQILRDLGMESDDLTDFLKAVKASNKNVDEARRVMEKFKPMVAELCGAVDMSQADSDWLWKQFEGFAEYSFNLAHATIYGLTAYRCAWFSTHYPVEYHTAMLNIAAYDGDDDKMTAYLRSARKRKIKILPPDVNLSGAYYRPEAKGIRQGVMSIKRVGPKAALAIEESQPYTDLRDFASRVKGRAVTGLKDYLATGDMSVGTMKVLDEAGALASLKEKTSDDDSAV